MKVLISFLLTGLMGLFFTLNAQNNGQLIVFVQDGRSISQDFKRNALPEIKKIANHHGLQVKMVDASEGAPAEVTYTPAIFYKHGDKNILFNGRYSEFDGLSTFIKTKGKDQPAANKKVKKESLTWNIGRATLGTTMHINPLSGKPPKSKKFDAQQFEKEATAALKNGMEYFRSTPAGRALPNDKSFHMEFYPEVKEGVMLIQMELFSEMDRGKAVFRSDIPSGYEWKEWQVAFEKAGNRIEKVLIAQISNWDNGDGFDTLKESTPKRTWREALSYQYKEKPAFNEKGIGWIVSEKE
jgi:hypothetical protein